MANVKEFADQLRIRDRENQEQIALNTDLRIQIDKLIDHLAASEIRIKILKTRWRELDEGSERKERELEDLEAEIESAEEENKALEAALKERNLTSTLLRRILRTCTRVLRDLPLPCNTTAMKRPGCRTSSLRWRRLTRLWSSR